MGQFTFRKSERLSKKKSIKELFEKGSSFYLYPFKIITFKCGDNNKTQLHQILISVSSRNFKKAVDRNLIKRRIREAYRLQKQNLSDLPQQLSIAFIYTHKQILPFEEIQQNLFLVLKKIKNLPKEKNQT